MLNGAFAFNLGALFWANAAMLTHNHSAKTAMSTRFTKKGPGPFFTTNKRSIIPPCFTQSSNRNLPGKHHFAIATTSTPDLFRVFGLRGGPAAFYRHLQRPAQHVVVGNCVLSHQHQQVAPGCVFRSD